MNTIGELRVMAQAFGASGNRHEAELLNAVADSLEDYANRVHLLNEALVKEISDHKVTRGLLRNAMSDLHYASGDHMGPST